MVIMALDHVRDYFNYGSFFIDPTDVATTTPILFFTRFITHYCAPVFVFLAGTSAFLYGTNKTSNQLSKFLLTRGIWLIFMEVVVNNLIWTFDLTYSFPILQVIWAIGFSMICLSFLIYLPKKTILAIGLIIIVGHNLLDGIVMEGNSFEAIICDPLDRIDGLGVLFGTAISKRLWCKTEKNMVVTYGFRCLGLILCIKRIEYLWGFGTPDHAGH